MKPLKPYTNTRQQLIENGILPGNVVNTSHENYPEEVSLVLAERLKKEHQQYWEIYHRAMALLDYPLENLPKTWKDNFKDLTSAFCLDLNFEDKGWFKSFLNDDETEKAFRKLLEEGARWTEELFFHIFMACKPSCIRARELDTILQNKDSAEKNKKAAIALSKYLKRVESASRNTGELFGTMTEVITNNLAREGITIKSDKNDPDFLSRILAIIGNSFENHICRTYRGPKFDYRSHVITVTLAGLFRERFNGKPLCHIVASLRNAACHDLEPIGTRDVENILKIAHRKAREAGLQELVPNTIISSKKGKKTISNKKSKK